MPHYSTWSRILGRGVDPSEVEQLIGQFFVTVQRDAEPQPGSIQLAWDGKTLRGTIPLGQTRGVHLLLGLSAEPRSGAGSDACG